MIRVALNHRTVYEYDRPVSLMPQIVRLKPAAHCRTPIISYALFIEPQNHYLHWENDSYGNSVAHVIFPERTNRLVFEVQLVADMLPMGALESLLTTTGGRVPDLSALERRGMAAYLACEQAGPHFRRFLHPLSSDPALTTRRLLDINRQIHETIQHVMRIEPGVQSIESTLVTHRGSARDLAWLLILTLRHMGLPARFVSGYAIQLNFDAGDLEAGKSFTPDSTELHAWAEVFVPGAGWVGLDPAFGCIAGQGYIPLACTAEPYTAAPITGAVEPCESVLHVQTSVARFDPLPADSASDAKPKNSHKAAG
jgi:transglutaminase-like putative cysteine protease